MKPLLLSLALLLSLGTQPATPKPNPLNSVVSLISGSGYCTAFSIDETKGYFLSAYHCLSEDMSINRLPASLVASSPILDMMIIKAPVHLPTIPLGELPAQDSEIILAGKLPPSSLVTIKATIDGVAPDGIAFRFLFGGKNHVIEGMSGGPVLNNKGEAVSMILCYIDDPSVKQTQSCGVFWPDLKGAYGIASRN